MHRRSLLRPLFILCFCFFPILHHAQSSFSRADSLKGSLTALRSCYDVTFYDLEVKIDPERKRIAGSNEIYFTANRSFRRMQIDLSERHNIARIVSNGKSLKFERDYDAVYIDFPTPITKGQQTSIEVIYGGTPAMAEDGFGGFVWGKDANQKNFIATNNQHSDASSWWPLKDHPSDEPDSMRIGIIIPNGLMAISNGRYQGFEHLPGDFLRFQWTISHSIGSNSVGLYIGDYIQAKDVFKNISGDFHHLNYYVLRDHKSEAEAYFKQIKSMMRCYEAYLGAYPFWKDDFKIVESPVSNTCSQNTLAFGGDFSADGQAFDSLLLHELAHEWFGNSLSIGDAGELWIQEAFATYMESIYVEDKEGFEKAQEYLNIQRSSIVNRSKILGPTQVNYKDWKDKDVSNKGSWMLHTLRQAVDDDSLWFASLQQLTTIHKERILTTQDVIDFFNQKLGSDYSYLFEQYLTHPTLPTFIYKVLKSGNRFEMEYRWDANEGDFQLPVYIYILGIRYRLEPTSEWQTFDARSAKGETLRIDTEAGLFEVKEE